MVLEMGMVVTTINLVTDYLRLAAKRVGIQIDTLIGARLGTRITIRRFTTVRSPNLSGLSRLTETKVEAKEADLVAGAARTPKVVCSFVFNQRKWLRRGQYSSDHRRRWAADRLGR